MTIAKVNGVDCVIYDFELEQGGALYCMCYFPTLGYRLPILAPMIEVSHERT